MYRERTENEFLNNYCKDNNKSYNQIFDDINSFNDIGFNETIQDDELPLFIDKIISDGAIDLDAKRSFMGKFGSYYLGLELNEKQCEDFRKLVDDCFFLFCNRKYEGAFYSDKAATERGLEIYKTLDSSNGNDIYIPRMYYKIDSYERKETISISTRKSFQIFNDDKIIINSRNSSFYVNVSLDSQQIFENEYNIDTGSTYTHCPFSDYIRSDTYRFNNYPFDKDNKEIIKDINNELPLLNKFIFRFYPIEVGIANNIIIKRMRILYYDGFYLMINNLKIKIECLTSQILKIEIKKPSSLSSLRYGSQNKIYERPKKEQYLLGLDILTKLKITINPLSDNYTIMKLEQINNIENENLYEIILLKSSLLLFTNYNNDLSEFYNLNNIIFGLHREYKCNESNVTNLIKVFITNRPLNLISLSYLYHDKEDIIKTYIKTNENIDGYLITQNNISSYNSIEIWLKDNKYYSEYIKNNNENENDDIVTLHNNKITSYFILK